MSSSRRNRPDEPPSSATVTMAEMLMGSHFRAASSVWKSPCPPPRLAILTEEVLTTLLKCSKALLIPQSQAEQAMGK